MSNIDNQLKTPGLAQVITTHLRALMNSLGQLSRAPGATIVTFVVIGIALALPMGLSVVLNNVQVVSGGLKSTGQINLYLQQSMSDAEVEQLRHLVAADKSVANVEYISPKQGLHDFLKDSGFSDVLNDMKNNPLPGVLVVAPSPVLKQPLQVQQLLERLKQLPGVEQAQLDVQWLQRLNAILAICHRIVTLLLVLFSLAVALIIGNTIRLTTQAHQQEIKVIKILGGTDHFIRRPFLYAGMTYGLAGAICAWFIVDIGIWALAGPVSHLATLYGDAYSIKGMDNGATWTLLISGIVLGWLGSWFAVNRYIRTIEPD